MSSSRAVLTEGAEHDPWVLVSSQPSAAPLYLANGYLGTALDPYGGFLPDAPSAPCYVRGAYSDAGPEGVDRLATVPCWSAIQYGERCTVVEYHRSLDLYRGTLTSRFTIEEERGRVTVEQTVFLSRDDQHGAALRLVLTPDFDGALRLTGGLEAPVDGDVATLETGNDGRTVWHVGTTARYGVHVAECLTFVEHDWDFAAERSAGGVQVRLSHAGRAGESLTLTQLVRVVTSLEGPECLENARRTPAGYDDLLEAHRAAWARLWETGIEIEGDPEVQTFARAGLFYLWSSMREEDHWSIAPMGLSGNFYNGHVFWDAELWMYPPLLVTQPAMAKSCVSYRERTMQPARDRAASNGHRGTQFPWEAAFTGDEMTPSFAETRDFQLHITADVAIGQWWYYLNTLDAEWLRRHGYPVIRECAEYWASRVEYDPAHDRYCISDVVCADEYAEHVDNNAFTNAAVRRALLIAVRAAELTGEESPPEWSEIAEKIHIPFDADAGRHLEYDGFNGQQTKQADVELLAYPLEHAVDREQIARNLDYYATVIDPNGPAMSFSVYSIVSAQLGRMGDAYDYLKRAYVPNTHPPFYAFSETPENHEYFFCTGVGGALQALLFGFTGLRLREGGFALKPQLAPGWKALRLRGLYVLGARTDIEIGPEGTTVTRHLGGQSASVQLARADAGENGATPDTDGVLVVIGSGERDGRPDFTVRSASGATLRASRPHPEPHTAIENHPVARQP